MSKSILSTVKTGFLSILLWAIISAAYIGPGSVTMAGKAGANFGYLLLWSVTYSTLTCLLLQEAAARLSIISGKSLGEAIVFEYQDAASKSLIYFLIFTSIVIGCAAYQTGNIMGAVVGLKLLFPNHAAFNFLGLSFQQFAVICIGLMAFTFLSFPSMKKLASALGILVLVMTFAFIPVAFYLAPPVSEVIYHAIVPTFPNKLDSALLVLGMIGTTVVPYDLFLGSGLMGKQGQSIGEMRFGLSVAVILGGLITVAILIVGTFIEGPFTFESLSFTVEKHIGPWARYLIGLGTFVASIATTITAPIASAITAQSLFSSGAPNKWKTQGRNFKITWISVLLAGMIFGIMNFEPVAAIIIAQALNGLILPFIAVFLLFVVNNKRIMGNFINGWVSNILLAACVCVCFIVGAIMVTQQLNDAWDYAVNKGVTSFVVITAMSVAITGMLMYTIHKRRQKDAEKY